ncbi:MAG: hypothetical protein JWN48_6064 [Myxococcaceae bacterium]|nr:hypothetical protein [Myxococcaceae bacterium]
MTHITAGAVLFALSSVVATAHAEAPVLVRAFDASVGEVPESISFGVDGNLYISVGNAVRRLTPEGALEVWGTLPITGAFALGVKVGPDGCVYNASTSLDADVAGAFVWRICEQGEVEQYAALDPKGGPNDLAFDEYGNLFVTDPILGKIYKVDQAGSVSVWLDDPLLKGEPADPALVFSQQGVNGIAFDKNGNNLFVGNLDFGRILAIKIKHKDEAGSISVVAEDPALRGADGIAFDEKGTLYVAVGAQRQLVSVDKHGSVNVVSQDSLLHGPSSVAFDTAGEARNELYIADSDFLKAFGIQPGPAEPNLVKLRAAEAGLPLLP